MTANDVRRMAFLLVRCLPANAQPSPRIVDQIDFPKAVDLSASSWTDAFTTLNKILSTPHGLKTLSGATISMHFGRSYANTFTRSQMGMSRAHQPFSK